MSWDLNRQATTFLVCLGVPWALFVLAMLMLCVLLVLEWLGVIYAYRE